MTDEWKQYKPKLPLYDILNKPGGVSVETALKRAETQLESHKAGALAAMMQTVLKLDARVKEGGAQAPGEIYTLSLDVLSIAGIYHPPICRAANSLCDLAQRMEAAGRWDWASVGVHVSSMRLLADMQDEAAPGVKAVLQGLASVVAKFPDPHPAEPRKAV